MGMVIVSWLRTGWIGQVASPPPVQHPDWSSGKLSFNLYNMVSGMMTTLQQHRHVY
jgi:hypothetical protein